MPLFNFATYADMREEWAIYANDLDHARTIIGDDPAGDWLNDAFRLDAEAIECQSEFATDIDDELPAISEITPDHWAWREAHRQFIEQSTLRNVAAISGDFHTHRLFDAFYDTFGKLVSGFVGNYEICISMANALTDWELSNGLGEAYDNADVSWIEVVEDFVDTVLTWSVDSGRLPNPAEILPTIQVLQRASGRSS